MPVILEDLFLGNVGNKIVYNEDVIYPYDRLIIPAKSSVRLKFLNKQSDINEGVCFKTDQFMIVDEHKVKNVNFWFNKPLQFTDIVLSVGKKGLMIFNNWRDHNNVVYSLRGNNGMKVQVISDKIRRYTCNYGFDKVDFTGMVFEIELLSKGKLESMMD